LGEQINPKFLKEVEGEKPRHTFGRTPFFLKKDPTGGLPMVSDPNAGPYLRERIPEPILDEMAARLELESLSLGVEPGGAVDVMPTAKPPTLEPSGEELEVKVEDTEVTTLKADDTDLNTVPMVSEEPTLEITTVPGDPPPDPDEGEEAVAATEEGPDFIIDMTEDDEDDEGEEEDEDDEDEVVDSTPAIQAPARTILRKMGRSEIYDLMDAVRASECAGRPELLTQFQEFGENATRGVMFSMLWDYFGYDKEG